MILPNKIIEKNYVQVCLANLYMHKKEEVRESNETLILRQYYWTYVLRPEAKITIADHHGPPKVNLWQDPLNHQPSKWKEEHVSFVFLFFHNWNIAWMPVFPYRLFRSWFGLLYGFSEFLWVSLCIVLNFLSVT